MHSSTPTLPPALFMSNGVTETSFTTEVLLDIIKLSPEQIAELATNDLTHFGKGVFVSTKSMAISLDDLDIDVEELDFNSNYWGAL